MLEAEAQVKAFLTGSPVPSGVQTPSFSDRCAASQAQSSSDTYSYVMQRMFGAPPPSSPRRVDPPGLVRPRVSREDDELFESEPSDEDHSKRTRGVLKTMVLDPIPTASGFRRYQLALYVKVCAASRHDGQSTMSWIQKVEKSSLEELEVVDRRWEDLDVLLAQAVSAVATGTLKRELDLFQDPQARQGRPMLGRAALHIVYQKFQLSAAVTRSIDLRTLMGLR